MAKGFDAQLLTKTFLNVAQESFSRASKLTPSDHPTTKSQNIIEYQGRMSVTAMEKFNAPTYISGVSFYLNDQDKAKHRAKGAIVLYLEASNAEKLLRGFGYPAMEDEDDEELLNSSSKLCVTLAEGLKQALAGQGAGQLVLSAPVSDKNSLQDGVEFSADQTEKQEVSFYFWKKKVLVVDLTMASLAAR